MWSCNPDRTQRAAVVAPRVITHLEKTRQREKKSRNVRSMCLCVCWGTDFEFFQQYIKIRFEYSSVKKRSFLFLHLKSIIQY